MTAADTMGASAVDTTAGDRDHGTWCADAMPVAARIDLVAEQSRLGGLERWLTDPTVDEVLVNRGNEVWIDRGGTLALVAAIRTTTLLAVIEQLLAPTGRRVDRSQPTVDARLADGSRLCVALEPVAVDGPCMSVRKFAPRRLGLPHFAVPAVRDLLHDVVRARCNIVVSGATSSGKTTLLGALAAHIEPTSRLVTLEDVAELRLDHPHVVRLETRDATPDGVGRIDLEHLVRTALRLRPDRLVVGEIRGTEAVHLLHALNTGHDGSMSTVHANSATDALSRLASLVLQAAPNWPLAAVRDHVARAIDVVVHVERGPDGTRRVVEVAEVLPDAEQRLGVRTLAHTDVVAPLYRVRRSVAA
ncbi:MAG: CpaF family protein [Ilumatobacteraceae bacterium]